MQAIYLVKNGDAATAFELRETADPIPSSSEVRIKVEAFGLNYADVMARNGLYREAPALPCVLGYEVVGRIDQVGENVANDLIGKRVVAFTRFGGYAEYALTNPKAFTLIDDLDAGAALSIATQFVTAYYMAYELTNLFPGDRVLVHAGAGGVGTALIQLCKRKGCEVFATAGSEEKLSYMREQGADHVIDYRKHDYAVEVKRLLGEQRLDLIFNPIAGSTFKKDYTLLGSGGRIALFGGSERSGKKWGIFSTLNFVRKMGFLIPIGTMMRSKSILGVNMLKIGDNKPATLHRCLQEVAELVLKGEVKPHIGGRFSSKEIAKAHALLEDRKSIGKIIVTWE
jgi:NADPH:quinone reductase-like Zn-dependent oxidoreductase